MTVGASAEARAPTSQSLPVGDARARGRMSGARFPADLRAERSVQHLGTGRSQLRPHAVVKVIRCEGVAFVIGLLALQPEKSINWRKWIPNDSISAFEWRGRTSSGSHRTGGRSEVGDPHRRATTVSSWPCRSGSGVVLEWFHVGHCDHGSNAKRVGPRGDELGQPDAAAGACRLKHRRQPKGATAAARTVRAAPPPARHRPRVASSAVP